MTLQKSISNEEKQEAFAACKETLQELDKLIGSVHQYMSACQRELRVRDLERAGQCDRRVKDLMLAYGVSEQHLDHAKDLKALFASRYALRKAAEFLRKAERAIEHFDEGEAIQAAGRDALHLHPIIREDAVMHADACGRGYRFGAKKME